jgi:hypothetical protein
MKLTAAAVSTHNIAYTHVLLNFRSISSVYQVSNNMVIALFEGLELRAKFDFASILVQMLAQDVHYSALTDQNRIELEAYRYIRTDTWDRLKSRACRTYVWTVRGRCHIWRGVKDRNNLVHTFAKLACSDTRDR